MDNSGFTYRDCDCHQHYLITSGDYDKNGLLCSGCNSAVVKIEKCKECGHEKWEWIPLGDTNGSNS